MKVIIVNSFKDVNDPTIVYNVGEEHEFEETRALRLLSFGHVVKVAEEVEEVVAVDAAPEEAQKHRRGRKSSKTEE